MNSQLFKNLVLWLVIFVAIIALYQLVHTPRVGYKEIPYSEFLANLDSGEIKDLEFKGEEINGQYVESTEDAVKSFKTVGPANDQLIKTLEEKGVTFKFDSDKEGSLTSILLNWAPLLLLVVIMVFFMRQLQAGGSKAMSFGKNKARMLSENQNKTTFKDVAGIDEAKEEVQEIVDFLKNPKKFTKLGGRIPKGILLVGSPGTGKTLLAKAIAGEAGVPFFIISGSDFVEMFVGVGASRVRDLFVQAKRHCPCIIFVDELDAVGRHRGAGLGGGHDEREQTLNQLLVEMDGFESHEGIILMAATNRPDVLDPALLRPGRFDRQVVVPRPDVRGREEILKVHSRNTPLEDDVKLSVIARSTPGFSGADLENLVNESALHAARFGKTKITMEDFEFAKDKVIMGAERKSLIISDSEKKITAYHEAGHALVARLTPGTDPIHKVTIIPRGMALGVTQQLPVEDRYTLSRTNLNATIMVLLGGRAAEELVFGERTSGAGNDLERVTDIARRMVCEWGMSEKVGPITFGKGDEQVFLGRDIAKQKDYSEETAIDIDNEKKSIVTINYEKARTLLEDNIDLLHKVAEVLLDKEVINGKELDELIKNNKPEQHPSPWQNPISPEGSMAFRESNIKDT
ncbi:MAG: ATP-dependent metallopeptidase FtsH/Yme1/Tma family protein [Thermodesulfobacteriales bacterium]|nr:MAG: ATP-dependent metallopeptidase FtsH/Yme1/Tma family protein [Thermodesulfobacteriales bacterium]